MEYVSLLAGEAWSDHPSCTHPALSTAAQGANDALGDNERHRLIPMIVRLFGTDNPIDNARFLLFIARSIEKHGRPGDALLNEATESFLNGEIDEDLLRVYYRAHGGTERVPIRHTTECARYAAEQALNPAQQWSMSVGLSAGKIFSYTSTDPVAWLGSLIDEYDRLSGRNETHKLTDDDMKVLVSVGGSN